MYRIKRIRTITGKEAKQDESAGDDLRLAFELEFSHKLGDTYIPIDARRLVNYTFLDTTFEEITNGTL